MNFEQPQANNNIEQKILYHGIRDDLRSHNYDNVKLVEKDGRSKEVVKQAVMDEIIFNLEHASAKDAINLKNEFDVPIDKNIQKAALECMDRIEKSRSDINFDFIDEIKKEFNI